MPSTIFCHCNDVHEQQRVDVELRQAVEAPIVVGGGISTADKAHAALQAGADVIVVGNKIEQDPDFLPEVSRVVHGFNAVRSATLN